MIFVIAFDRGTSALKSYETFADADRSSAERLYRSLLAETMFDVDGAIRVEVNMFESASEAVFRQTHARYFQTAQETLQALRRALVA